MKQIHFQISAEFCMRIYTPKRRRKRVPRLWEMCAISFYVIACCFLNPSLSNAFLSRAGFTLSGTPVQKKMWGPSLIFPRKKLATFFCSSLSFTRCFGISEMQKIRRSESSRERIGQGPIGRLAPGSELARERKGCEFCGGPLLWGPLFGRTCWTCLNPPLFLSILIVLYCSYL